MAVGLSDFGNFCQTIRLQETQAAYWRSANRYLLLKGRDPALNGPSCAEKRRPLSGAGHKGSSCKAARLAATTAPLRHFLIAPGRLDAVPSVPVVAAGGIADGRTVAAALALGADAVWVGTRLLASFEAYAHPQYKDRIVAAGVEDTARHLIFGPEFPDASTRGLRNRVVREWEGVTIRRRTIPFPIQSFR